MPLSRDNEIIIIIIIIIIMQAIHMFAFVDAPWFFLLKRNWTPH
jgi:hypothetical protein